MNSHRPFRISLLLVALVILAACKQDTADPDTDPLLEPGIERRDDPLPPASSNPIDAMSVIDHGNSAGTSAQAGALDTRALAGRFSDGSSLLELRADGTYVQTLQIQGAALDATGTWAPIGPAALLLDPSSKSAEDAVFLVASNDELNSEDGALTFRRVVAP